MGGETKHTPGPWVLDEDYFSVTAEVGAHICCVTDVQSLPCLGEDHDEEAVQAECLANARLIAAAPELLAGERENLTVLENLLAYLRKHPAALPPLSLASLQVRVEKTRAAIAKASGDA